VVIDHDHQRRLFPLGTMNQNEAGTRAAERFRTVLEQGWRLANLQYEQEFTIGIFWKLNPTICTYSTMLTIPARMGSDIESPGPSLVLLVEPDEGVRRAIRQWLAKQKGWNLKVIAATRRELAAQIREHKPTLVLLNQEVSGHSPELRVESLRSMFPSLPIYPYGLFEDSDGIFGSLSGVKGGYMLRRRPPERLLDPLLRSPRKSLSVDRASTMVHRYFQRLVEAGEGASDNSPEPTLTLREHEVMKFMAQGLQDKEIASKLDISTWTVNSHVRHIYRKLGVHGRTEAVVKFLEFEGLS
jgi:two-component system nitrate/nitrite response regulator NarL